MEKRLSHHLTHKDDEQIIASIKNKYDSLTRERKDKVKKLVINTPDTCGGRARLFGHRLEIELIMYDYLSGENCYEINDYTMDDLGDICAVWFFETWMESKYFKMVDY